MAILMASVLRYRQQAFGEAGEGGFSRTRSHIGWSCRCRQATMVLRNILRCDTIAISSGRGIADVRMSWAHV